MTATGLYDPSSLFSTVTGFITTNLLPATVGLLVLSISVRLAFKAVKKFAKI